MANTILNFHFDYPHPSLICYLLQLLTDSSEQSNSALLTNNELLQPFKCDSKSNCKKELWIFKQSYFTQVLERSTSPIFSDLFAVCCNLSAMLLKYQMFEILNLKYGIICTIVVLCTVTTFRHFLLAPQRLEDNASMFPSVKELRVGVGDIIEKIIDCLYIGIFSIYRQIIEKIDLEIIEKLSLSKMSSWFRSDKYCSIYPSRCHNLPPTFEIIVKFSKNFQSQHREFQNLWEVHRQSQVQNLLRQT